MFHISKLASALTTKQQVPLQSIYLVGVTATSKHILDAVSIMEEKSTIELLSLTQENAVDLNSP
jgi:hypothetical protein